MIQETLNKANELNNKINELKLVLRCFEWNPSDIDKDLKDEVFSTNPELIIEFDGGDGREVQKIPIKLNSTFITLINDEIKKELKKTEKELKAL